MWRIRILLFVQGWEIERQLGLLPPNLCSRLDRMIQWYDVDEIATFLREYETLDTTKEARKMHIQQFCMVLNELMLNNTTASTPANAQDLSSIGNVTSEPTIIHVDEPIGATRDSLAVLLPSSKSEHSRHPTTVSEMIESCRIALLVMMFAPLVGVGIVMISLALMSSAANCECIPIIQVLATLSVYIVSAIMKLSTARDMCITSIASISSFVWSCSYHQSNLWHSTFSRFMRSKVKPCRLIGCFQHQVSVSLACSLSGLGRMRIKLSSFVTSFRATFSGTVAITSFIRNCTMQCQPVIKYVIDTARKYSSVVPCTRERASPSTATYGQSKACSRRSRKKRQYDQRIARRRRPPPGDTSSTTDKLIWFISDTCNTLLQLCVKLNSRISAIIGRALARFHM